MDMAILELKTVQEHSTRTLSLRLMKDNTIPELIMNSSDVAQVKELLATEFCTVSIA